MCSMHHAKVFSINELRPLVKTVDTDEGELKVSFKRHLPALFDDFITL